MIIDVLFIVLMIIAALKGFNRGLIVAVFSFIAIIVGLAAAMKFSAVVAGRLQNSMHIAAQWLPFLSFGLIMTIVILLIRMMANIIQKTTELVFMGWANRVGGIILYAIIYTTVFSVVLFFAEKMHLLQPETVKGSKTYAFVQPWGPKVIDGFGMIVPLFKDLFAQLERFFESISNRIR